jgi:hypothetical protein
MTENGFANPIELSNNFVPKEHGLCDAAETHWGIYLIQAIKLGKKLESHTGTTKDGKKIKFLIKGENKEVTGFTFGVESMLIYEAEVPELTNMIAVQEGDDTWLARSTVSFSEALRLNEFDDPELPSRWKEVINEYAQQRGINPYDITLSELIASAV